MKNSSIVEQYLKGLQERLPEDDKLALSYSSGASFIQLARLKWRYPRCPGALLWLLKHIDGTYWRKYGPHTIAVLILGSDVFEYPYYLKSVDQILERKSYHKSIRQMYGEYMDDIPELVGAGIDQDININR